jgi:hypothetical protein
MSLDLGQGLLDGKKLGGAIFFLKVRMCLHQSAVFEVAGLGKKPGVETSGRGPKEPTDLRLLWTSSDSLQLPQILEQGFDSRSVGDEIGGLARDQISIVGKAVSSDVGSDPFDEAHLL